MLVSGVFRLPRAWRCAWRAPPQDPVTRTAAGLGLTPRSAAGWTPEPAPLRLMTPSSPTRSPQVQLD